MTLPPRERFSLLGSLSDGSNTPQGEAGGGALLALGLATPAAGAAVAGTMGVAASMHAPKGFFAAEGGLEYPALLGVAAGALALTGPGQLSVDRLKPAPLRLHLATPGIPNRP